jgi:ADP-ribose pyrophosphatase YjhB (NUDIX family)
MSEPVITRDFTATTFIVKDDRTLLLLHRKLGIWLPPGGHIDPHELPHDAALREVREETGYEAELLAKGEDWGTAQRLPQPHCILLEDISPGHQHIDLVYFARVVGGALAVAEREAHHARWMSEDDLGSAEIHADIRMLGRSAIAAAREE